MVEKKRITEVVIWVGLGSAITYLASTHETGSLREPGPGLIPLLTGVLIVLLGLLMIKKTGNEKTQETKDYAKALIFPRLAYTILVLVVYIVLFERLGFVISTFLAMFGLSYDVRRRNYFESFVFSGATSLLGYLIFEKLLRCQLPKGIMDWW
ncbi:MAG: tripartite tricarboxylate transporter TctB family protein [Candidatus Methanomethyliaceae archaeon]